VTLRLKPKAVIYLEKRYNIERARLSDSRRPQGSFLGGGAKLTRWPFNEVGSREEAAALGLTLTCTIVDCKKRWRGRLYLSFQYDERLVVQDGSERPVNVQ
jgi:hypothetical protein